MVVAGGTLPYKYLWNTGDTTANLSNIAAGNYSLTVTDAHGCFATLNMHLIALCKVKLNVTQPNCFDGNDGSAAVTPSGGIGPYAYLWSTGETTKTIYVGSGTYSVTVTDQSSGCAVNSGSIGIKQPKELKATVVKTNTNPKICTGQATLSATGGTMPYTFTWEDGYSGANRTGLCQGSYNVTVADANGCSTVFVVKINTQSGTASLIAAVPVSSDFTVSAFPSPTNGVIQLSINSSGDDLATAYLYDMNGRLILAQKISVSAGTTRQTIDLSHYMSGIYQLRTVDGKNDESFRIILTK